MNVAHLSDADLASELLAPAAWAASEQIPRVCDAELACRSANPHDAVLTHKLSVARELLMRDLLAQMRKGPMMESPQAIKDWLRLYCAGLEHEIFLVLYLDARHALIEAEQLFRGTLTQTSVYPRELVKGALLRNAAAIAVAHAHPSGDPSPSLADEHLTMALKQALCLVDVRLIDHFIVAGSQVLSFAEKGLL